MLKKYKADLHIHTCLSPCADLSMTPSAIVKSARERGVDIIAVTDHNSAENVIYVKRAAENTGLTVLAGMEIASSEEAHVLALFETVEAVMKLQDIVYKNMPYIENDVARFGDQVVVNEENEVLSFHKQLLIAATALTAGSLADTIHLLGGLCIASHIDREAFSIVSQLGFIPPGLKFDALEISPNTTIENAKKRFPEYSHIPFITSSDAHYIHDIGKAPTDFFMHEPTFEELRRALMGIEGRGVIL